VEQLRTDSLEIVFQNIFRGKTWTAKNSAHQDGRRHKNLPHGRRGDARAFNIDLTIDRGEYVSIAGPSGCGKSTLLSVLGLLDSPSSGKYFLNGKDVSQITPAERTRIRNREIGFVFQAFISSAISPSTKTSNCPHLPKHGAAERKEKTEHALERVGCPIGKNIFPRSSPAASSNVLRSRAPSAEIRSSSWPMSPQAISIRKTVKPSCSFSPTFTRMAPPSASSHTTRAIPFRPTQSPSF